MNRLDIRKDLDHDLLTKWLDFAPDFEVEFYKQHLPPAFAEAFAEL